MIALPKKEVRVMPFIKVCVVCICVCVDREGGGVGVRRDFVVTGCNRCRTPPPPSKN